MAMGDADGEQRIAFFGAFEQLIREHGITIDRPKGTAHPHFPDLIYPINYGYINGTRSQDGKEIDAFIGDCDTAGVAGIICSIDAIKRDSEVKVLYNCTEKNIQTALQMMNSGSMRGIFLGR
jgi:inorganic pyrophosphatase